MLRRDPGEPINDHHHHHQRISGSRPTDPLPTGGSGRGHYQFLGYFNVEIPYFRGILVLTVVFLYDQRATFGILGGMAPLPPPSLNPSMHSLDIWKQNGSWKNWEN